MKRQVFDQAFKQMAVELSYAKGSLKYYGLETHRLKTVAEAI